MRVTANQLAQWYGVERRTVTNWVNSEPPCPSAKEGRDRVFDSVAVARWHQERTALSALAELPGSREWDAARTRKMVADAARLELQLAVDRGEMVPLSAVRETWRRGLTMIRAQLLAVPGRYSPRTVGLASLPESQRVWDAAVRDILAELRDGDTEPSTSSTAA